jgi:hypothetical protein
MHTGLTRQQVSDPVGVISRLPQCLLPPLLEDAASEVRHDLWVPASSDLYMTFLSFLFRRLAASTQTACIHATDLPLSLLHFTQVHSEVLPCLSARMDSRNVEMLHNSKWQLPQPSYSCRQNGSTLYPKRAGRGVQEIFLFLFSIIEVAWQKP